MSYFGVLNVSQSPNLIQGANLNHFFMPKSNATLSISFSRLCQTNSQRNNHQVAQVCDEDNRFRDGFHAVVDHVSKVRLAGPRSTPPGSLDSLPVHIQRLSHQNNVLFDETTKPCGWDKLQNALLSLGILTLLLRNVTDDLEFTLTYDEQGTNRCPSHSLRRTRLPMWK